MPQPQKLVKTLLTLKDKGVLSDVHPVWKKYENYPKTPWLTYRRSSGDVDSTTTGEARHQIIDLSIYGSDYGEVTAAMDAVLERLLSEHQLWQFADLRDDSYIENLELYVQEVEIMLT